MQSTRARVLLAAAIIAGFVLVVIVLNRDSYGDVSPKTYQYAKALYSICNRQDEGRLGQIAQMIAASESAGEIPVREAAWLKDIVEESQTGNWQRAAQDARLLMEAQIK